MNREELQKEINKLTEAVERCKNEYVGALGALNYMTGLLKGLDKEGDEPNGDE